LASIDSKRSAMRTKTFAISPFVGLLCAISCLDSPIESHRGPDQSHVKVSARWHR
jgi:hypothetical protein